MSREVDRRDFTVNKVTPAREDDLRARAASDSARLPGEHRISIAGFDAITGNPATIRSESAPPEKGNYIQRALNHVQAIGPTLGLVATQPAEFVADPHAQETSSGAVAVHLQQQYKGIPIFQAAQAVRFAPDGSIKETAGSTVTVARDVAVAPKLSAQDAVLKAAQHVATPDDDEDETDQFGQPLRRPQIDLTGFVPNVIAAFPNKPERSTVLAPGPFADQIKASLIWVPLNNNLRLAWEIIITLPDYAGQYRTMVDAENGEILYCRQLIHQVAARGNVFHADGARPRQVIDFPRPLATYGLPIPANLPAGFPDSWVETDSTVGNAVFAHLDDNGPTIRGNIQNGVFTFDPADPSGDEQKVLNIFYLNCYMHDYFYLLGFREADGNFQQDDFGRGGTASDRVDARSYSGPVNGTANMLTLADGTSPIMQMGLVESTGRHTAFDSGVVFHEFTHGVTNRLVGGRVNTQALDAIQSAGMGEGWSDYFACTINNTTVIGAWVLNNPGGLRQFPYDSNYPDHFGMLGQGRYTKVHNIGEIWCATLMEMNRRIGASLGVQLVVDALKLSPANPSFLDARDSILAALDAKLAAGQVRASEHATIKSKIWATFARFGMGPGAKSNGASLSGIVADFSVLDSPILSQPAVPSDVQLEAAPELMIPDDQPGGVTNVLTVAKAGRIKRLVVSINIEHPFIGDLRVSLTAPDGSTAVLHDRAGTNTQNLVKPYTSEDTPSLAKLTGKAAQGAWTLTVADLEGQDVGILHRWSLAMDLEAEQVAIPQPHGSAAAAAGTTDDFKRITGIGPVIERRLHDVGIRTYGELAALSATDVVARAGLSGLLAERIVKQDWIGQARALAAPATPPEPQPEVAALSEAPPAAPVPVTRQHYATFTVDLLLDENNEVRRTRVVHVQEGGQDTWAGWQDGRLVRFFVEHAALQQRSAQPAQDTEPDTDRSTDVNVGEAPGDLQLAADDIVVEDITPDRLGSEAPSETRLRAQIDFHLSGKSVEYVTAAQLYYLVHILGYAQTTGQTVVLAAMQNQLRPGVRNYTATIEFSPSQVGRYQLLGTVVLIDYKTVGAQVGPMLTVVP